MQLPLISPSEPPSKAPSKAPSHKSGSYIFALRHKFNRRSWWSAASGVSRSRSSRTANFQTPSSYVDMNPATTKPRLGPPGCILHCCGVVVWSGQQQQHASPCITLSSFLQIPNGSRALVWDAIVAGCRVLGLLHSNSLRSCRTFQTTSLSHLTPLCLCTRAGNKPSRRMKFHIYGVVS